MKSLQVVLLLLFAAAALSTAEPPRRRFRPVFGARLMEAPPAEEAPYPPSGWKPAKPFYLPGEYGSPDAGPPPEEGEGEAEGEAEAGPETTTAAAQDTTTEEATTTATTPPGDNDGEVARDNDTDFEAEPEPAPANIPAGVYYVLLPDGRLQRVNYQVAAPSGTVSGNYVLQEAAPAPYSAPFFVYQTPRLIQILEK